MNRVSVDMTTLAKLNANHGLVEVCDESGQPVGYFHPLPSSKSVSPFSREELERRRQQRSGRSLREILEGLERS